MCKLRYFLATLVVCYAVGRLVFSLVGPDPIVIAIGALAGFLFSEYTWHLSEASCRG